MQDFLLTEQDRRLIHALQLSPRARWQELSDALGASPTSLSRRWERLSEAGAAWTSGFSGILGGERRSAVLEIDTDPSRTAALVERLMLSPAASTLDIAASGSTVVATLVAVAREALTAALLDSFGTFPGIREVRSHLMTHRWRTADSWTLRALTQEEADRVPRTPKPRARAPRNLDPAFASELSAAVCASPRASISALARQLGASETRVGDGVAVLIDQKALHLRTDVANELSGWPVHVWYFIEAPPRRLELLAGALADLQEIRFVSTAAGPANLVFDVWLRDLESLHHLEAQVSALSQAGVSIRRQLILRTPKRLGYHLDHLGRRTGPYVPQAP